VADLAMQTSVAAAFEPMLSQHNEHSKSSGDRVRCT